jgi:short subunit fatty acids transporter
MNKRTKVNDLFRQTNGVPRPLTITEKMQNYREINSSNNQMINTADSPPQTATATQAANVSGVAAAFTTTAQNIPVSATPFWNRHGVQVLVIAILVGLYIWHLSSKKNKKDEKIDTEKREEKRIYNEAMGGKDSNEFFNGGSSDFVEELKQSDAAEAIKKAAYIFTIVILLIAGFWLITQLFKQINNSVVAMKGLA